jgi:indole-3-glycerol phosphate synthase
MNILDEINKNKRSEVTLRKESMPIEELKLFPAYTKKVPSLSKFLLSPDHSGIIAEHKRQSPSKGVINGFVTVKDVAEGYQAAGASAISVLTDWKYFGGTIYDLMRAAEVVEIPILRKDFIIDEYQIHEAKAIGASAILLIAASLSTEEIKEFTQLAHQLGMEVLFEVHNEEELKKVAPEVDVIGINNRDLKTFKVDIEQSIRLAQQVPEGFILISESGISQAETVKNLRNKGFKGFLMGENFMKEANPGIACQAFIEQIK